MGSGGEIMYRTYSVNDMPQPIKRRSEYKPKEPPLSEERTEKCSKPENESDLGCVTECAPEAECIKSGLLSNLKIDDLIIFAVIVMLVMDSCDDKLLIIALGFILFSDFL